MPDLTKDEDGFTEMQRAFLEAYIGRRDTTPPRRPGGRATRSALRTVSATS